MKSETEMSPMRLIIMALSLSATLFMGGCSGSGSTSNSKTSEPDGDSLWLKDAKLLIEHNATDKDTGFQAFADGEPWNELSIIAPNGERILTVSSEAGLFNFGLTELFFETSEPKNSRIPIDAVLAQLPAGDYIFSGDMVDGGQHTATAKLTHSIPSGPVLKEPVDGSTGVDPDNVVISWDKVITGIDGRDISIVGYQVVVELDEEAVFSHGFARPLFSVHLPATASNVTVPKAFIEPGTDYHYEVLAIEKSGNQTLASATFTTRSDRIK